MKLGTTTHPKFKRLQKLLGLPQYAVVGLLEMIWSLASQYADDGDLTRFSAQELADYCEFDGDADSLLDALVLCRWIDRDADSLRIHDWEDHRPDYIADKIRKREERASKQSSRRILDPLASETVPVPSGTVQNLSGTFQDSPGKSLPNHAKPSHALPGPVQPSQIQIAAASLPAAAIFNFALLEDTPEHRQAARDAASKLDRVGSKVLTREFIWTTAWISEAVCPGFCSEMATKLKGSGIKSYRRYVEAALRGELAKVGVTQADCARLVPPVAQQSTLQHVAV